MILMKLMSMISEWWHLVEKFGGSFWTWVLVDLIRWFHGSCEPWKYFKTWMEVWVNFPVYLCSCVAIWIWLQDQYSYGNTWVYLAGQAMLKWVGFIS